MKKAKDLMKQADELNATIDEYMDNGNFEKALEYLEKQNELLKEGFNIEDIEINRLLDERINRKSICNIKSNYFSSVFLKGLQTKSHEFQCKFFEIMNDINVYFDEESEIKDFHKFIEKIHSYDKPGNILYSSKVYFGGEHNVNDYEELKQKFHFHILHLFDSFEASDAMGEVPHIIVCISAPDGCFTDEDINFVHNLIKIERIQRGYSPVEVTSIVTDTKNNRGISCYVATLK